MKKKLRLLLFKDCNRKCEGCCNKEWDLDAIPTCDSYEGYDEIFLTGGEPMLNPKLVLLTVRNIRKVNKDAKIYIYTAWLENITVSSYLLSQIDGITVTLHNETQEKELDDWMNLHFFDLYLLAEGKSLRLNVFKGCSVPTNLHNDWKIKKDMVWIKGEALPDGEVFMKL